MNDLLARYPFPKTPNENTDGTHGIVTIEELQDRQAKQLVADWKEQGIAKNLLWHMPYIHGIKSDDAFMAKLVDELLYKVARNQIGVSE